MTVGEVTVVGIRHEPGRWAVRRSQWAMPWGPPWPAWVAAGPNLGTTGYTATAVFGEGVDEAAKARRFAAIASRRGAYAAEIAAGWHR